jgi:hypothetical protein
MSLDGDLNVTEFYSLNNEIIKQKPNFEVTGAMVLPPFLLMVT